MFPTTNSGLDSNVCLESNLARGGEHCVRYEHEDIPPRIMGHYNLDEIVHNRFVCAKTGKAWCGLAKRLAKSPTVTCANSCCANMAFTQDPCGWLAHPVSKPGSSGLLGCGTAPDCTRNYQIKNNSLRGTKDRPPTATESAHPVPLEAGS